MNVIAKDVAASGFDAVAWREELLALNPWARGLTVDEDNAEFAAARQKATLARHAEGEEVWNGWANAMLALKAALETAGQWAARGHQPRDRKQDYEYIPPLGENEATQVWLALSASVFSTTNLKHRFETDVSFHSFVFPTVAKFKNAAFRGEADFTGATFGGSADFSGATFRGTDFSGTTFSERVDFARATFSGGATFHATFSDWANFSHATFSGASFQNATFSGVVFWNATFGSLAHFSNATFSGEAQFGGVAVSGPAWFDNATFNAKASFWTSQFKGSVTFANSIFRQAADFDGVDSAAAFVLSNVAFKRVPGFIGATFKGKLRLDNVETPRYRWTFGYTPDKDATARFRELRRQAAEAQDHDREMEFFAQEVRTGRFHAKGLPSWVPKVWSWRFWFGLGFGALSDFGRSLWRPLLSWLVLTVLCAAFFLGEHEDMRKARAALAPNGPFSALTAYAATTRNAWDNPPVCREPFDSTNPVTEAILLSLKNAVVFNIGSTDPARRTFACLYGLEKDTGRVPAVVFVASMLQALASGLLIFLFVLAVRNLLRLK
jgi:uncharacterized protein YjbI with pentapeptide repeats